MHEFEENTPSNIQKQSTVFYSLSLGENFNKRMIQCWRNEASTPLWSEATNQLRANNDTTAINKHANKTQIYTRARIIHQRSVRLRLLQWLFRSELSGSESKMFRKFCNTEVGKCTKLQIYMHATRHCMWHIKYANTKPTTRFWVDLYGFLTSHETPK